MRQLLLFVLVYFVGTLFTKSLRHAKTPEAGGAARAPEPALVVPMVQCGACGVHLPKGEAISRGVDYFCCAEHAAAQAGAHHREAQAS